jgi:UV DNA damage repair endonuclease
MNILYGLISVSELLKERESDGSYTFSGMTKKNFLGQQESSGKDSALSDLSDRIIHNLDLTENIIDFLPKVNISHYRISSSIFSLASDFSNGLNINKESIPNFNIILNKIKSIGLLARQNNITLSIYPDSSNSLISSDELKLNSAIEELNFHNWFLETAGFPSNPSSPIIIKPFQQPSGENHDAAVECVQLFYKNFKKLNKETQNRIVIQNEDSGFWNPVNLFKYFHVYLYEKYEEGMVLSYYNIADERNSGYFGSDKVDSVVNIGAFHETWMGVVPIFLWSEKKSEDSNISTDYLSKEIPNFGYTIKWECDVLKRDKAIVRYTMPQEEDKVTEEVINTITKNKYKKSRETSRAFNALYDNN